MFHVDTPITPVNNIVKGQQQSNNKTRKQKQKKSNSMFYILVYKTGGGSISKVSAFQKEKKKHIGCLHGRGDTFTHGQFYNKPVFSLFFVCSSSL